MIAHSFQSVFEIFTDFKVVIFNNFIPSWLFGKGKWIYGGQTCELVKDLTQPIV